MLAAFLTLTFIQGKLAIRPYDPWAAYHHLLSADLFTEFSIGFIVLLASLIGSLFINRVFCRYLCPMGGFLALIRGIGVFRVKRNDATCIHCNACDRICPVDVRVESVAEVKSAECINCCECVNVCPVPSTLWVGRKRRGAIRPTGITLVTVLIFTAVVATASFTGGFEWKMKTVAEHVEQTGEFSPDAILGRNTFKEISDITGIPADLFLKRFNISEEQFRRPIKESAHREGSEFDTESVREFVRERLENQ
jgi:polyferredoxin